MKSAEPHHLSDFSASRTKEGKELYSEAKQIYTQSRRESERVRLFAVCRHKNRCQDKLRLLNLHGLSKFNRQFATCTGACTKVRILDGQCHCQGNKRRDDITLRLADIGRWFFASFRTWIKHLRYTWTTESNESLGILTVVLRSCHGKVIYLLICSVFTIEVLKSLKQNKLALFWLCHVLALAWCCGFPPTVKHRAASLWRQHWSTLGLEGTLIIFAIRAIRSITERCHGALPLRELNM